MRRKTDQAKNYTKIMKQKRESGEIEEVPKHKVFAHNPMDEEPQSYEPREEPEGDWEDEFEDEYEEEEAWISDSQGGSDGDGEDNTIQSEEEKTKQNNNK